MCKKNHVLSEGKGKSTPALFGAGVKMERVGLTARNY